MFGLMKARICFGKPADREARRLSYCGTCKTLGSRYGQRSRLFLDHDTVFLAELLDALQEGAASPVDPAFRSFSCLSLPKETESVPLRLRYAAAVNVFLAKSKIADRQADSPSPLVDMAARAYAGAFGRAEDDLVAWGVPVSKVRGLLDSQTGREDAAVRESGRSPAALVLARLAEPTAEATGLFFENGARLAGESGLPAVASMGSCGRAFGTLVYLLDAFEDFDRDATRGEFNAFGAAYAIPAGPLPESHRPVLRQAVWSAGIDMVKRIEELPIAAETRGRFSSRLRSNLAARLGAARQAHVCAAAPVSGEKEEGRSAIDRARAIAAVSLASWQPWLRAIAAPVFLFLALPLALFLPSWARPERGLGESLGLLLNLMFAGGVVRSLVSPLRFSAAGGGGAGDAAGEAIKAGKRHAKGGGSGDGGGGDCCCDCDCDCCSCDGCDCGGCDC